ncbi:MAG: hypothetical protein ACFFE6_03865 [Candidatus Thorarchaeota archaeon]
MNQDTTRVGRFMLFILVAALIAPHTFEISSQTIPDYSYTRYSLILVILTLFYESGTTIAGQYSTGFILPPTSSVLLNVLTLVINVSIVLSQWGYAKGRISRKNVLYIIGIALCVHVLLLIGFFSYQLDATASVLAIPLPIFPVISALVVLRGMISNS